jgi:excisionase family DNA binding protein
MKDTDQHRLAELSEKLQAENLSTRERKELSALLRKMFTTMAEDSAVIAQASTSMPGMTWVRELVSISQSAARPMSAPEAADYMHVKPSFLYKLTSTGQLGFWKSKGGKKLSFTRDQCDAWLLAHRSESTGDRR